MTQTSNNGMRWGRCGCLVVAVCTVIAICLTPDDCRAEDLHVWLLPLHSAITNEVTDQEISAFCEQFRQVLVITPRELLADKKHARLVMGQRPTIAAVLSSTNLPTNVQVRISIIPWSDLLSKLPCSLASAAKPHLVAIGTTWIPKLASESCIVPLDRRYGCHTIGISQVLTTYDGKSYGWLRRIDIRLLFFRRDLKQKFVDAEAILKDGFPRDWDDLENGICRLRDAIDNGTVTGSVCSVPPRSAFSFATAGGNALHMYSMLVWANGGAMFDVRSEDPTPQVVFADNVKSAAVMSFLADLKHGVDLSEADELDICERFAAGEIGVVISGAWMGHVLAKVYGDQWPLFAGVKLLPAKSAALPRVTFCGGTALALTRAGRDAFDPETLRRVARFFTSGAPARSLTIPADPKLLRERLSEMPIELAQVIDRAVYSEEVERGTYPLFAQLADIEPQLNTLELPSVYKSLAAGHTAVASAQLARVQMKLQGMIDATVSVKSQASPQVVADAGPGFGPGSETKGKGLVDGVAGSPKWHALIWVLPVVVLALVVFILRALVRQAQPVEPDYIFMKDDDSPVWRVKYLTGTVKEEAKVKDSRGMPFIWCLLKHAGRSYTRDDLVKACQGEEGSSQKDAVGNAIRRAITNIREQKCHNLANHLNASLDPFYAEMLCYRPKKGGDGSDDNDIIWCVEKQHSQREKDRTVAGPRG